MTAAQKCGERTPAPRRDRYCSVCAELQDIPQDDDDAYLKAANAIFDRLDRLTRHRTLYHRRHRRW